MSGRTDAGNIQFIGKSTSSHVGWARVETNGDVAHVRLLLHVCTVELVEGEDGVGGGCETTMWARGDGAARPRACRLLCTRVRARTHARAGEVARER